MLTGDSFRAQAPMVFRFRDGVKYLTRDNRLSDKSNEALCIPASELQETMEYISEFSMYAHEEEIKRGYLTIAGGHRIGLAGTMLVDEGRVQGIKYISCLCIRLSHEIIGCSDALIGKLFESGSYLDSCILSPPGYGKTTLLRDLIRNLSNGFGQAGYQVGVVDERSELAASYLGVAQNDVGKNTDVYDSCPKDIGIRYFLRSMAPQIIAVDELFGVSDLEAVEEAFGCGCKILASTHASSLQELYGKRLWKPILDKELFRRYIVIERVGNHPNYRVFDEKGRQL